VSTQALTIGKRRHYGTEFPEPVCCHLLRRDVFLERECVHPTELTSITIRGQGVVGSRCVVAAADEVTLAYISALMDASHLSGEYGPTKTLPAFCTEETKVLAFSRCNIRCSGA
jgi:hypothetical protein